MKNIYPVVAIIPSLNPDDKLKNTVNGILAAGFTDVILVDDGSRENCRYIFDELEELEGCVVLHHEVNKGKGRALKTAFSYYLNNYSTSTYLGVVTADADGQHLPKDIKNTADILINKRNNTLALGTRDFNEPQVPFKSRNGNKITTVVFKMLYGKLINDTQTGLRAITNDFTKECLEIAGERFEYEINMLIFAVRNKIDIKEVIIETVYFDDNRETHFNPVKDSIKIYKVMLASFLKFAVSGVASMLLDQGLFALMQKLVLASIDAVISIPVSTAIARVISSLFNFTLNKKVVFNDNNKSSKAIVRYYILCVLQMCASALLVTVLFSALKLDSSLLKLIVDLFLFFISYRIQQAWVFNSKK